MVHIALHPKVRNGSIAGAVATVIIGLAANFGVSIDAVTAAALATIVVGITGYQTSA